MPIPTIDEDAAALLTRRSPAQRHAIARILVPDGAGPAVMAWIVSQPDCDRATLAMVFWRLRCVPAIFSQKFDAAQRNAVLARIAQRIGDNVAAPGLLAWDGREAWTRERLIGAPPLPGIDDHLEAAARLQGPFGAHWPEPASLAFLDEDYAQDDIFDSLWLYWYNAVAVVDLLENMSAEEWLATVDSLCGSHPDEIFEWVIHHPRCTDAVAAKIFRLWDDDVLRGKIIERWHAGQLVLSGLDYRAWCAHPRDPGYDTLPEALRSPPPGRTPDPDTIARLSANFAWYVADTSLGGLVPRPRAAAEKYHRQALERALRNPGRPDESMGEDADIDTQNRNFRRLNLLTLFCAALTFGLWRMGLGTPAAIAFIAALLIIPGYLAFVPVGSSRRQAAWFAGVAGLGIAFAFIMRFIDKGAI